MSAKKKEWQSNADKRKIRGLIGTELIELFEAHDNLPVAAHLINILRSKGNIMGYKEEKVIVKEKGELVEKTIKVPVYRDPYYIEDNQCLKEIENYRNAQDDIALEDKEDL